MSFHLKKLRSVFCLTLLAATYTIAAEKPLLEVNFGSPSWRELMPPNGRGVNVKNNVVALESGAVIKTELLPVRPGEFIIASVETSSKGLVPPVGQPPYCDGSATFLLCDRAGKEYSHLDICHVGGDSVWMQHTKKIMPDGRCAFVRLCIGNYGGKGQAYFRNLKIATRDSSNELIKSDGNDANTWFIKKSGSDWEGLKCKEARGQSNFDKRFFVTDKQSIFLSGGAVTLVSKSFPYNRENLILSGWLRSENLKAGKKNWGGGIQAVGFDNAGKIIVHKDLELISQGTNAWRIRRIDFTFPDAVKKIEVWLRMAEGAGGNLWLDGICLSRQPLDQAPPSFNKDEAKITVDLSKPEAKEINYRAWAGVGGDWINREDVQQCLPMLKAAGFEYIRMRDINNTLELYPCDNKDGSPAYNWEKIDKLFDILVAQYHFVPIIALGHTPRALDRPGAHRNWTSGEAPSDMKKWGAFNEAIFEHVIQRYGKETVSKWLWEIWNEPIVPSTHGEFVGSAEDFASLAAEIYLAKERIEKKYGTKIQMGLTSGAPVANPVIIQRLKAMGKEKLIDHVSYHNYAGVSDSVYIIPSYIAEEKALLQNLSDRKDYMVGQSEWNCTYMVGSTVRPDMPWNATLVVKMAKIYLDSKLDYSAFFHLVDHAEQKMHPSLFESGDFGLFTRPNEWPKPITHKPIPKPAYNAFVFLNELRGGKRLLLKSSNDPVDGIATVMPDGAIRIVLTSYDEDITRQPYTTNVTIKFKGLSPTAKYRCAKLWAADEQYGNSYGEWVKLGKTPISDVKANEKVMEASKYGVLPPPALDAKNGELSLTLPLPGPGIRMIELKPE